MNKPRNPGNNKTPAIWEFLVESPLPDSNRRPLPYHGSALPTELRGRRAGPQWGFQPPLR
jgi:hypothetical protein